MDTDLVSSPRKWEECRICHDEDDILSMENPCSCSGTLKMQYAHRRCVQRWCNEKGDTICEICLQPFKPGYSVPSPSVLSHFSGISMNFGNGRGISRSGLPPNTGFLGMVSVDHLFMDPDNQEFSVQSSRSLICCRLVATISTILLLMRLTLPIILSVADKYSATESMLLLINIVGVILLILMMVKVFTAMQHLAFQQYSNNTPQATWDEENELPWQHFQPHLTHVG